ncbi:probable acyl-CoA dehydrogenase 6 isoform X1 [Stegodyphus dumicola]|uniref:probable acyl-CoA dehydrogenase 6 isoform X1 n=1 Tax=Stegodyphus dumicola TaxID=202533 RepID=UPI0015B2C93B|nr:probable acyl-CoA dehydrogenase 6 isoform X1 [Stegodyphus dumicola]
MFKISSTVFKLFCSSDVKCFHLTSRYRSLTSLNLFTREHDEMRKTVNKIIEKDINPFVDEWEKAHKYPAKQVFQKLGNAGLLGITKPTQYGGLGLDYSFTVAFLEELSNINCSGVPMSIAVQTDMAIPALARFGSEELKQEFLAPTIAGDKVACIGVSEVHCGSDVASISTKAVRKGDDLIINGGKMWITNGTQADWMCMLANTRDGPPHKNKSLICVPLNLPGISFNIIHKLGTCSSDTAQFFFEDVKVPAKNIIGEEGMGFIYQMLQFQDERLAAVIGVPPRLSQIIQATVDYCKERKAFGQPIINNQVIHYTLAELQSEVEALRSLIYRAAAMMIDGQDVTLLASMAKLKAGRLAREVTDKCLQFWGGMGYTSDVNISRAFRDARLISIAGGSDEIMLSIISKFMGTFPKTK